MKARLLFAILCAVGSASAAAQLTGHFRLDKETFAQGEPVFLYLSVVNNGPGPAIVFSGEPEQPACSGIWITVSSDPTANLSCPVSRDSSCIINGQFQTKQLQPGQTYDARFLLNLNHAISEAGDYTVDAKWTGFPIANDIATTVEKTQATLEFRIETKATASSGWKPYLEQLRAPRSEERHEAASTLASLAPPSLEQTLLGFENNPEFRAYAPLALHRLNTRRSTEALARFMEGPVTNEQIEAAHYLAETNNPEWYPLLRDAAEKNPGISNYPIAAAELGGEKILPLLIALEKSPDRKFAHLNAIMAMGSTGSRAAIPILLEQLRSPDKDASDRADGALQLLTHRTARTAVQYSQSENRENEYLKWSRWWQREGASAPIYKDSECGQMVPLP